MSRFVLLAGAALALSAGAALSADMVQIKTEAEFRKFIVGKKLTGNNGYTLFQADNQISGTYKGMKQSGFWSWIGDTYCRPLILDGKSYGNDCRTIAVKGNTVTTTRKAGKGKPFNLTIADE